MSMSARTASGRAIAAINAWNRGSIAFWAGAYVPTAHR